MNQIDEAILYFFTLIVAHWVFDFVLQSDTMALNKSKKFGYLFYHCSVYGIGMSIVSYIAITILYKRFLIVDFSTKSWFSLWLIPLFFMYYQLTHIIIDRVTSQVNSYLYNKSRYYFFVSIGFDQVIYYGVIVLAVIYMRPCI